MLFQYAQAELPLLVFTLLVPTGLTAMALVACVQGFFPSQDEAVRAKATMASGIAAALLVIGLIAAMMHLGSISHIFNMVNGIGTSPLTNEIVVAGVAIAAAMVYWIIALVKRPEAGLHKAFGIALIVLALATAAFTGFAYAIPTLITWSGAYGWLGQIFLALLGGASLAAVILAVAKYEAAPTAARMLAIIGIVAALGVIIVLVAQGTAASAAVSSTGATLADRMGDYQAFAIAAGVCAVIGCVAWVFATLKDASRLPLAACGCIIVFVALALVRVDFYGIMLNVGIM